MGNYGSANELWENDGAGSFTLRTGIQPVSSASSKTIGIYWVDYDSDGDLDMFALNDGSTAYELWNNQGNFNFAPVTVVDSVGGTDDFFNVPSTDYLLTVAAWGDCDGDGKPDVFAGRAKPTSSYGAQSGLYMNRGLAGTSWVFDVGRGEGGTQYNTYDPVAAYRDTYAAAWGDVDGDGGNCTLNRVIG